MLASIFFLLLQPSSIFASPVGSNGLKVALHRRAHQPSGLPKGVFDPRLALAELALIPAKYADAKQLLSGVSLTNLSYTNELFTPPSDDALSHNPLADSPLAVGLTSVMPVKTDVRGETNDYMYYGELEMGTPPQRLSVDIDTGSADTWMPVKCSNCVNNQFEARNSTTYNNTKRRFQAAYTSSSVSGTVASDVVKVDKLVVPNQHFGAVNHVSAEWNTFPNDGLLGLAFGSIARSGQRTFFENLMVQKSVAANQFSIHLTRHKEEGSEVCFGCFDASKSTGKTSWVPVISKTYWSLPLDGIIVNTTRLAPTDLVAAIDTGTTYNYVPKAVADLIYQNIPGSRMHEIYGTTLWTYPCGTEVDIAFSFLGQRFIMDARDFNVGQIQVDSLDCVASIFPLPA